MVEAEDFLANGDGHERVQFAGRFVVEDELRLDDERAGDGGAFLHAAGKFARVHFLAALEPDELEFVGDDAGDLGAGLEAVLGEVEADVFADGQGAQQGTGLEDHGHAVFVHDPGRLDGFAFDENLAGIGGFEADDVFEEDALAAAAGTHDDKDFAAPDVEVDAVEDGFAAEGFAESPDGDVDAGIALEGFAHAGAGQDLNSIRMRVTK